MPDDNQNNLATGVENGGGVAGANDQSAGLVVSNLDDDNGGGSETGNGSGGVATNPAEGLAPSIESGVALDAKPVEAIGQIEPTVKMETEDLGAEPAVNTPSALPALEDISLQPSTPESNVAGSAEPEVVPAPVEVPPMPLANVFGDDESEVLSEGGLGGSSLGESESGAIGSGTIGGNTEALGSSLPTDLSNVDLSPEAGASGGQGTEADLPALPSLDELDKMGGVGNSEAGTARTEGEFELPKPDLSLQSDLAPPGDVSIGENNLEAELPQPELVPELPVPTATDETTQIVADLQSGSEVLGEGVTGSEAEAGGEGENGSNLSDLSSVSVASEANLPEALGVTETVDSTPATASDLGSPSSLPSLDELNNLSGIGETEDGNESQQGSEGVQESGGVEGVIGADNGNGGAEIGAETGTEASIGMPTGATTEATTEESVANTETSLSESEPSAQTESNQVAPNLPTSLAGLGSINDLGNNDSDEENGSGGEGQEPSVLPTMNETLENDENGAGPSIFPSGENGGDKDDQFQPTQIINPSLNDLDPETLAQMSPSEIIDQQLGKLDWELNELKSKTVKLQEVTDRLKKEIEQRQYSAQVIEYSLNSNMNRINEIEQQKQDLANARAQVGE